MRRILRSYGWQLGAVLTMLLGFVLLAETLLHSVVNNAIMRDAERKAVSWAGDFVETFPELADVVAEQSIGEDLSTRIQDSLAGSEIFRFKVFAPDGRVLFVSDQARFVAEGGAIVNDVARTVFLTRVNDVEVKDGTGKLNRPAAYVEAYVPAIAADGRPFGVIEVYVDITSLSATLFSTVYWLSMALVLGSVTICMVPSAMAVLQLDKRRQRDAELIRMSRSDALTGVLNRSALTDAITDHFPPDRQKPVGLFFIDVDKFKIVNDTYGHDFGDQLLRHIARTIEDVLRPGDVLARNGGDEFVALLPGIDSAGLMRTAQQLLAEIANPFRFAGTTILPSISIGAHLSPPGETNHRALHAADLAVYQAKSLGRGRVCEYSARLDQVMTRRRHVEQALSQGLASGQFSVHYQPIYGADATTIVGFEALARMRGPDGRAIGPDEFIPVAEEAGKIEEIGLWVLRTALAEARDWPEQIYISVNLSSLQFRSGRLIGDVTAALADTGMAAERLVLEVTESLLIDREDFAGDQIITLKSMGIAIALDDFGTGYSSLGHLWKYPFDKIKIDRVFLEGFDFQSEKFGEVIATLVMLGRKLGMTVTVEGVERNEQLDMLRRLGCDEFQGFLLDRPLPATDVRRLFGTRGQSATG